MPDGAAGISAFEWVRVLQVGAFFLLLVVCGYTDLAKGKVYDWATYPAIGLGLGLAYALGGFGWGMGWLNGSSLLNALLGGLIGAAVPGAFALAGWVGGGDVKLAAAVGSMMGPWFLILALLYGSLVGAIFGAAVLLRHHRLREGLKRGLRMALFLERAREKVGDEKALTVPYGLAMVIGCFAAFFLHIVPGA